MTEKRYYLEDFKDFTVITLRLYDRKIKYKHYDWLTESHKIVDLLNKLEEENRQLRLELDTHKHPLWSTREAERVVNELKKENEKLKQTNQRLNDELQETMGYLALKSGVEKENEHLKKENQRMTDKLNELALEFLNYDMVSMGKATEISEMCYYDFLKYRKDNGNPMELRE